MNAVLLIASMALTQQCAGGSCSAPMPISMGYVLPQFQQPVELQPMNLDGDIPATVYQREEGVGYHWVEHEGLRVKVWGKKLPGGNVRWNPAREENADAISHARALKAVKAKAASNPPAEPSAQQEPPKQKPAIENFGLSPDRIGKRRGYSGNIREYGAGDEQGKMFLTVIGSKEERAALVRDFQQSPEFNDLRDKVNFNEFERGDWQVKDELGYHAEGSPTILVQHPDGRVAWRAYDYAGGAGQLAQALRKADPHYSPEKDPGPHSGPAGGFQIDPMSAVLVLGVVLLIAVLPRRAK